MIDDPDDDLRVALAAADPVGSAPMDPVTSPRARELMERTMRTDPTTEQPVAPASPPMVLLLSGDDATLSCVPFSELPRSLAETAIAFAGEVSAVSDGEVRLRVTRWYRGGEAATVVLRTGEKQLDGLLGPLDLQAGKNVLIAANEGSVSRCGLSGPADPQLQAVYDEVFGG
jgi:hypothetical protein